jgi:hypothetical protein
MKISPVVHILPGDRDGFEHDLRAFERQRAWITESREATAAGR